MTLHGFSEKLETANYFTVKKNGSELFKTDRITVDNHDAYIIIEGSYRLGFREGQSIRLVIDRSTPDGEQMFVPDQRLREVLYLNQDGTQYAFAGRFNSTLDNINKKYRLSFKLKFNLHTDDIEVELDVS